MNDFGTYETPHRYSPEKGDHIDEYTVLELLGEGSFGVVWKVRAPDNEIKALKLIKLWEIASIEERKALIGRFVREFEIAKLRSPYLARSYAYGKKLGNPYIVLEFCAGGSLGEWVGKFASHPRSEKIAYDILRGLGDLHSKGYFHRDIKPQNILLTEDGDARLTDFGIAGQKSARLTVTNIFGKVNQIFGTWAYLAPEQENNKLAFKAMDAVTDIFSFGVTLFELFTGEYPFPPYRLVEDRDLAEYRAHVLKGNCLGIDHKKAQIPGRWLPIIRKCLHPDFQHGRYRSVGEIIEQLGYQSIDFQPANVNSDKLAIRITYGEELNKVYDLTALLERSTNGILTLGRKDPSIRNDIEIRESDTAFISRRHATIERWEEPKCWMIRDGQWTAEGWKSSYNGIFLNSRPVGKGGMRLHPGDILTLGDTVIKIVAV